MRLRYAVLCDYAASGAQNKPTCVGIYDCIMAFPPPPGGSYATNAGFVHGYIDAPSSMGPRHLISMKLIDADGNEIVAGEWPVTFGPKIGNDVGIACYFYFFLNRIPVAGPGDYQYVIYVDGMRIGAIDLTIVAPPPDMTAPSSPLHARPIT